MVELWYLEREQGAEGAQDLLQLGARDVGAAQRQHVAQSALLLRGASLPHEGVAVESLWCLVSVSSGIEKCRLGSKGTASKSVSSNYNGLEG